MMPVCIFIETKTFQNKQTNEERFVRHIIELFNGDLEKIEITGTDGYKNLKQYKNQMLRNTAIGGKNLVIFDADFPETDGGFEKRREDLLKEKEELGVEFELFLFPNNQGDGTFEHLLEYLTVEKHQGLLKCFERYERCISGQNSSEYEMPDQKAKMYTYISALKKTQDQTKAFKNGDWFFNRIDLWNFDVEYLDPLKEFLMKHLS
jgi:hypothetical protein